MLGKDKLYYFLNKKTNFDNNNNRKIANSRSKLLNNFLLMDKSICLKIRTYVLVLLKMHFNEQMINKRTEEYC